MRPLVLARIGALVMLVLATAARPAQADECTPAVTLRGDAAAVAEVGELLAARGIAIDPPSCPALATKVERHGDVLAIVVTPPGGAPIDRMAPEAHTAATVIESFVRADVGLPLLATRAMPVAATPEARAHGESVAVAAPPAQAARGVHLFGAFETSYASDHTSWVGAHVGACVMLGPVCAAARIRFANVASGPGVWKDEVERRSIELLVGLDIPFAIGRAVLSPGFAAGLGQMHTHGATHGMRSETGGMRADVHATLSIPLASRFALDVFTAADLTQETAVELGPEVTPLPPEPRLILRAGVGLRYGGL